MVRLIPEQPAFTTASEQAVWERLRDQLGHDDVLLANQRLTDEDKDHEADLVVFLPDVGVVVLEVKGGSVWHADGGWWTRRHGRDTSIDPVEQARRTKYAFKSFVETHPRWGGRGGRAWAHGVVTPYSGFGEDFAVPELPRSAASTIEACARVVIRRGRPPVVRYSTSRASSLKRRCPAANPARVRR